MVRQDAVKTLHVHTNFSFGNGNIPTKERETERKRKYGEKERLHPRGIIVFRRFLSRRSNTLQTEIRKMFSSVLRTTRHCERSRAPSGIASNRTLGEVCELISEG